jgi:2,3-dihydroxybenzoate decarboxylase
LRTRLTISGYTYDDLIQNLADIHGQRIRYMDDAGVDYMILSLASPGIQGVSDPQIAEGLATRANNEIAEAISNNTFRFGAFAALSMHNASQAAQELRRCVERLGFHGALINDYQQSGADNSEWQLWMNYTSQPLIDCVKPPCSTTTVLPMMTFGER